MPASPPFNFPYLIDTKAFDEDTSRKDSRMMYVVVTTFFEDSPKLKSFLDVKEYSKFSFAVGGNDDSGELPFWRIGSTRSTKGNMAMYVI